MQQFTHLPPPADPSPIDDFADALGPEAFGQPQPCAALANDVFQDGHDPSSYTNKSPTTMLDLGSGTIHHNKSPVPVPSSHCDDSAGWQHYSQQYQCYQPADNDYRHHHHHHHHHNQFDHHDQQYVIKTEDTSISSSDGGGGIGHESLDLMYPVSQEMDYYAAVPEPSSKGGANDVGLASPIDFIGANADALTDASVDFMVLDPSKMLNNNNNDYYMDPYCAGIAVESSSDYSDFSLNWSQ
ncbi:uncharacterized protein LOC126844123 [Adelges cooleyi]|uniref:uncharacterized protein LOC126844123 n=1 Tax=Adelges cooleyi TaxID=133065 RepID=UPI0021804EF1|nr:uncharacterized protein LOC126844123 [Adelges cooleyi]